MSIPSSSKELDSVVVPITDDHFDVTMDEWLAERRGEKPRVLPRTTAELLDEARADPREDLRPRRVSRSGPPAWHPGGTVLVNQLKRDAAWWVPEHYFVEVASVTRRAELRGALSADDRARSTTAWNSGSNVSFVATFDTIAVARSRGMPGQG